MYQKGFTLIHILIITVFVFSIMIAIIYFSSNPQNNSRNSTSTINKTTTTASQEGSPTGTLAKTTFFYSESGNESYIKMSLNIFSPKIQFTGQNSLNDITSIYSQDDRKSYTPIEIKNIDSSKFVWNEMINKIVEDSSDSQNIYIADRIFSFKKIPGSNKLLLVLDWARSNNSLNQSERILYLYDPSNQNLKKIERFTSDGKNYSYPKIGEFSPNNKFVSIYLFGCWNCGGHQPETLLLDLTNFKTKNIGKVLEFKWGENGNYNYKDYIVIECKEPQPGECTKNSAELPLRTDHF